MSQLQISTKTVNITFLYESDVLSVAKSQFDDIRKEVISIWQGEDPIIAQFPDVAALSLPTSQFSCLFDSRNRCVLSNQAVMGFDERSDDIEKLLRFAIKLHNLLRIRLKAYGYNYTVECKASGLKNIVKKFFNMTQCKSLVGNARNFIDAGLTLKYRVNSDVLKQMSCTPSSVNNAYVFSHNVHMDLNNLPDFSSLSKDFKDQYEAFADTLNNLK